MKFLRLGVISAQIGGIVPDKSALFGMFAAVNNINNYSEALTAPINAGSGFTITTAQFAQAIINITAASGGFNATLPTTVQLLASLGNTIPLDGSYSEPFSILNNGSGQTATLVAGDANTTVTGNATVANNTRRLFQVTVNAPNASGINTITFQNLGTMNL